MSHQGNSALGGNDVNAPPAFTRLTTQVSDWLNAFWPLQNTASMSADKNKIAGGQMMGSGANTMNMNNFAAMQHQQQQLQQKQQRQQQQQQPQTSSDMMFGDGLFPTPIGDSNSLQPVPIGSLQSATE